MKVHRVREAKSTDGIDKPHLFIEVEEDLWVEVSEIPSHEMIEAYNEMKASHMKCDTRAFEIGLIEDWKEEAPITE